MSAVGGGPAMIPALHAASLTVPGRLKAVSLDLGPGELVAVVGPNGAGKSTLMQALAGLLPAEGIIQWNGQALSNIPMAERGRRLAWVSQEALFEFAFPVREVVAQGRYAWGDDVTGVAEALAELDLTHLADRPATRLSGGERHRVSLARALATQAPIQLWDEPVAQLDVRHALEVLRLARRLTTTGNTIVVSLHDLRAAYRFDRVLVLDQGRLVGNGGPHQVLTAPLIRQVFRVEATFVESLVPELPCE
jgi:iron complex transport system ATP-binding protein